MRTVKKNRQQNPLPFLAFLGILLISFIVFVVQTQQTQSYVSRAAEGPYPTSSSCHFPCAAPACSDGFKGNSFCGDGGSAGCNVQQDEWCRLNGHIGQKPCYEIGTCNTGGGTVSENTPTAAPAAQPTATASVTPVPTGIPSPPAWFTQLPTNLRNYLELLYLWVVVYRRPTNQQHLLEGILPQQVSTSTPADTPQLTPTIPPANVPGCTQKYSVVNGQCVPDNASTMCLEVCQLLIPPQQ